VRGLHKPLWCIQQREPALPKDLDAVDMHLLQDDVDYGIPEKN